MTIGQAARLIRANRSEDEFVATLSTVMQSEDCFDLVAEYSTSQKVSVPSEIGPDKELFRSLVSGFGSMAMGIMIGKMIERANAPKEKK